MTVKEDTPTCKACDRVVEFSEAYMDKHGNLYCEEHAPRYLTGG